MPYTIQKYQDTLVIIPQTPPDWDAFIPWAKHLLSIEQITHLNTIDSGADRHRLVFTFERCHFSLNYENYSDSIWIETDEPAALAHIDPLSSILKKQQPE